MYVYRYGQILRCTPKAKRILYTPVSRNRSQLHTKNSTLLHYAGAWPRIKFGKSVEM
jgi:hypothetical protein